MGASKGGVDRSVSERPWATAIEVGMSISVTVQCEF